MESKIWNRREVLKSMGFMAIGSTFLNTGFAQDIPPKKSIVFSDLKGQKPKRAIKAIVLGAGGRGNVYASYALKKPDEFQIVGVAEPIDYRRNNMAKAHNIPDKYQFVTWEDVFNVPKFADAVIVSTPDNLHYKPAMEALEFGYDMILEKAIAQSWKECYDILKKTREKKRIVAVCHVLRYTPYFRKLKEVIDSGVLGKVVSVQHLEPVEHIHMSHSFVRGNWRNSKESNPMILSKSCHDTDIIRWLIGKPCQRLSSFGSLSLFKAENAPKGSTLRCSDGCKVEADCPYSALKIYYRNRTWLHHLNIDNYKSESILHALKTGPYGRCVYHCDNDVVDHQVVNMEFEDHITASFSMEAFTHYGGRRTRIMGTMGDIVGDMTSMTITDFRTGKQMIWDARKDAKIGSGHGGGDYGLVHDFVRSVSFRDESLLSSTIEASMESHLIGFKAEESRLKNGKVMEINMKKK